MDTTIKAGKACIRAFMTKTAAVKQTLLLLKQALM